MSISSHEEPVTGTEVVVYNPKQAGAATAIAPVLAATTTTAPIALHEAVKNGDVTAVSLLVEDPKLDINQLDSNNQTALHIAIAARNLECITLLMKHGAKISHEMLKTAIRGHEAGFTNDHINLPGMMDFLVQQSHSLLRFIMNNASESIRIMWQTAPDLHNELVLHAVQTLCPNVASSLIASPLNPNRGSFDMTMKTGFLTTICKVMSEIDIHWQFHQHADITNHTSITEQKCAMLKMMVEYFAPMCKGLPLDALIAKMLPTHYKSPTIQQTAQWCFELLAR